MCTTGFLPVTDFNNTNYTSQYSLTILHKQLLIFLSYTSIISFFVIIIISFSFLFSLFKPSPSFSPQCHDILLKIGCCFMHKFMCVFIYIYIQPFLICIILLTCKLSLLTTLYWVTNWGYHPRERVIPPSHKINCL